MGDESISETILTNAQAPRRASGDAGSMEAHPISDLIAADRYAAAKRAYSKGLGIRHVKLVPPNAANVADDDL